MNNNARSIPASALPELRRRAVSAYRNGMKKAHVARTFGIARSTLMRWINAYELHGEAGLENKKRGRPPRSRLTPVQTRRVCKMICDGCPDQLKMPFALWTREAVGLLLSSRFEVKVSVWTVGRYLKRWGFTPQKPLRRAYERDPAAVEHWLNKSYPEIVRRAHSEGGVIHWGDEMGLRSDHQSGRSYGLKGQTPVVEVSGRRFGCNMISTITNRGELSFMVFEGSFTAPVFIRFLKRLLRQKHLESRRVFLIIDSHPVHKSRLIQDWVEKYKARIELHFLPGYSPELNPDELLNQDTKANTMARHRPHDRAELVQQLRTYLRSTQRRPDIVRSYFQGKHVKYAAM